MPNGTDTRFGGDPATPDIISASTDTAREGVVPADVRRLVIAARVVTDAGYVDDDERELFDAVEAFSSRVPYEDEPDAAHPSTQGV